MGTWGPGIYANDLAKDLKSTVSSVVKLPLEPDELVKLLEESFPEVSREGDEEFSTFWLVVADLFHKLGINDKQVFERAKRIIDGGIDAERTEIKELAPKDQQKRQKTLAELRERLKQAPQKKTRKTLSKPQPLLMNTGDLVVFPIFAHGNCINPFSSKWTKEQEGWKAACIVRAGHVFGYLAYYYPLVLPAPFALGEPPTEASLRKARKWELRRPGVCTKPHFAKMKIDIIGNVDVDEEKLSAAFPKIRDGRYQAINGISLADAFIGTMGNDGTVNRLGSITADS